MSLDGCVRLTLAFQPPLLRRNLALLLGAVSLGGSLVKATQPLAESYFSNRRNVFNVYFVKFSWGWTMGLLLPFIFISNYFVRRDALFAVRRLTSCVVGTVIWFLPTRIFHVVENFTGRCFESQNMTVLEGFETKDVCSKQGHSWVGFDISGHSFLLSYCILMIMEETAIMNEIYKLEQKPQKAISTIIKSLFIALNILFLLWIWMFFCTAVYFHDLPQKMIGTILGISAWYLTYKFWYMKPFSPGLPPEIGNKDE
ncbi:acyl-coenzyme A diphosphatase FITM2 [Narcine bancroftii]|uniref:acyl-coenzyme A diphosphatase FITM2 n=1 Tax=Narcine bancroftii TaxID=1343680 RepID=UPI0038310891